MLHQGQHHNFQRIDEQFFRLLGLRLNTDFKYFNHFTDIGEVNPVRGQIIRRISEQVLQGIFIFQKLLFEVFESLAGRLLRVILRNCCRVH